MVKASIYFVLTAAFLLAVFIFMFDGKADPALLIGSAFLLVLNILSFVYINGAFDKRPAIIIRRYMASMTIKLFLSVGLLVWYMTQSADKDKATAVFLVVLYFFLLMLNGVLAMAQVKRKWGDNGQ